MTRNLLLFLFALIISFSCSNKIAPTTSKPFTGTLKVMAYNVHHCEPPSKPGVIDLDAIVNVINRENPDLIALQEIDVNINRSGKINQASEIARKAGYPSFYFSKAIDYDGGDYGVLILSKYPLSEMETHRLPTEASTKGEPRVFSLATVTLPGGKKIKFGSTHLDAQREPTNRILQANEISRVTSSIHLPLIIAGDFNAVENSDVMQIIKSKFTLSCSGCAPTIPQINPTKTIDFIGFRPGNVFEVLSHKVVQEPYASDHLPVVAELRVTNL